MHVGDQALLLRRIGGQTRACDELGVEHARHPLFSAADLEFDAVLLLRPLHRPAELTEGLVESGEVSVPLGVGKHAVAVEDERFHEALPTEPKVSRWLVTISCMAFVTCLNSDGGSHLPAASASRKKAKLDCI